MNFERVKKGFYLFFVITFVMSNFLVFKIPQAKAKYIAPYAQLSGKVTNSQNNQDLANVDLKLLNKSFGVDCTLPIPPGRICENGYMGWQTTTDSQGSYSFALDGFFCGSDIELTASLGGYQTKTIKNINVPCWESLELNIQLDPVPLWRVDIQPGDILYDPYAWGVGHTGLYVGDNKVIEAQGTIEGLKLGGQVNENDITMWDYPNRKNVYLLRVKKPANKTDEEWEQIKNNAIQFAKEQKNKPYDWHWLSKSSDPNSSSWYCSELVWAAYYNQGIDLEFYDDPYDVVSPVSPAEIFLDDDTYVVNSHYEYQGGWKDYVFLLIMSPVEVTITDPSGNRVTKDLIEIPGATYIEDDIDENGHLRDMIALPNIDGEYQVEVVAKPGAGSNETYSLVIRIGDQEVVLAQDETVPEQGETHNYSFNPSSLLDNSSDDPKDNPGHHYYGFYDIETSSGNTYSMGSLDFSLTPASLGSVNLNEYEFFKIANQGSLNFVYRIKSQISGDMDFCNDLNFRGLFTHHQSELSGVFTNFSLSFSSLNYTKRVVNILINFSVLYELWTKKS